MQNQNYQTALEKNVNRESDREKIFHCIYTGFFDKVCRSAYLVCGTEETAKDLTQNVFMKVWRELDRLHHMIANWKSWENYLFIMTKNEALNYKRKQAREVKGKAYYYKSAMVALSNDVTIEKECEAIYNKALKNLTERQSEVYLLDFHGIKRDAIAQKLGITCTTVSNTLNDARRRIRMYVSEELELTFKKKSIVVCCLMPDFCFKTREPAFACSRRL